MEKKFSLITLPSLCFQCSLLPTFHHNLIFLSMLAQFRAILFWGILCIVVLWMTVLNLCIHIILFCFLLVYFLAVWGLSCAMWDLVLWSGVEPWPPALGVWHLSHWTTREVPMFILLTLLLCSQRDLTDQVQMLSRN